MKIIMKIASWKDEINKMINMEVVKNLPVGDRNQEKKESERENSN